MGPALPGIVMLAYNAPHGSHPVDCGVPKVGEQLPVSIGVSCVR
jgi:hypothetical protein